MNPESHKPVDFSLRKDCASRFLSAPFAESGLNNPKDVAPEIYTTTEAAAGIHALASSVAAGIAGSS